MMGTSDVSRIARQTIEHDQVELMFLELLDGGLAIADADDPIALALEIRRDRIANGLLVLDQQNLFCVRSHNQASLSHSNVELFHFSALYIKCAHHGKRQHAEHYAQQR